MPAVGVFYHHVRLLDKNGFGKAASYLFLELGMQLVKCLLHTDEAQHHYYKRKFLLAFALGKWLIPIKGAGSYGELSS